jgi:hypothetical protein
MMPQGNDAAALDSTVRRDSADRRAYRWRRGQDACELYHRLVPIPFPVQRPRFIEILHCDIELSLKQQPHHTCWVLQFCLAEA